MNIRKISIMLAHALVGWALCGAVMLIGREVMSLQATLIVHALAAPIIFAFITWFYFSRFAFTTPLNTALVFVGTVIFMDIFVVAIFVERSFVMFASLLGTWLPFVLIFASSYLTSSYLTARKGATGKRSVQS